MLLISVSQADIIITDTAGTPLAGASICTDTTLIGISDANGEVSLPDGIDSLKVRVIGYETWEGAIPSSGSIYLMPVPVPSGMVISVSASRCGFRDLFPATTVLGRDDLEYLARSGLRALTSRSAGIYVREYGGAMPVISISIRGSDAAHSEYYIDGHDISSSMDCLPGMTLDPVLFGGLEISRGGGSGFLRGGMTGTLNFIPESSGLPPRASLIAGDDESISLSAGFTKGINRITLSIRKLKGTAGSTACNGAFLVNGNTQPFSYGILAAFSAGETESPEWALPADGERKRYSFDGWGRWSPGRLRLSLGIRTGRHEYFSTQPSLVDDRHDEFSGDLSLEYNVPLLKFQLGLSALSSLDRILSTSIGERERLTGEAALTVGYADGISVSASSSLNMVSSERSMYGAALSIGLPVLDSLLLLHTSASTGFRRPSLNDLYWPEDNFALGNPDLLPETSREIESGISFSAFEYFSFSATAFIAETEDMIRWEPAESGKWSPLNISRALRKGIEMQLWFSDTPIELTGTLTLLEVTDNFIESVNYCRTLPYTPDYTFGVQAGLEYPRRIHWSVSASGMGIRFKNYSETSWMPAYTIFTAGVYLFPKIMGSFSLNASMENIFDQDYQETSGYSGKPRTLHFGIEWNGN